MRDSRSGIKPGSLSRARTNAVQSPLDFARDDPESIGRSDIADLADHLIDSGHVRSPRPPFVGQHPSAFTRQPVEAALAFSRTLDPAALDPATILEPEQRRIERGQ